MTRRTDNKTGTRHIARNIMDACVRMNTLVTNVSDCVLNDDRKGALTALNELQRLNFAILAIMECIADKKFSEAELLAEGMNEVPKKGQQKATQKGAPKVVKS